MNWEYRVLSRTWPAETVHAIYEVFYEDGESAPSSCTSTPVSPAGETLDELRTDLKRMTAALDKPVLPYEQFKARS